ncbi:heme/hemin ABC transporter substrate-binding protein [Thalassobius sp. S69A]|uniref:heme/hemin ABC transporter substrate-binding protein n=1 Tax=unclassified Thalassovita TaxID=2619711 RepID=UPI000C0E26B5|nr:hemin ABC transporter substrate-binding protein [Paracoccaceae bacterium]MBT26452.1 hemin ABC transporter substrate-binding protein [Paracoccaceae bacterium]
MIRALIAAAALLATPALADSPQRVVSLGGAVTEIVVALGAGDLLVGRDSTSTYPAQVLELPDVGYVRALSPESVLSLGPDLILAEATAGPAEAIEVLQETGVGYVALPEKLTPEGVTQKIALVGHVLGREAEAVALTAEFEARMAEVRRAAAQVQTPKRVLFVLSLQGGRVMAGGAGSSAEAIIQLAGGVNAAQGFHGYKQMTDEAVLQAAPDVILMMDRRGHLAITPEDIRSHPALSATPAAMNGDIQRLDGMLLLGFGPRTPQGALALNRALYGAADS